MPIAQPLFHVQPRLQLVRRRVVNVQKANVRALLDKHLHQRRADAGGTARDENVFAAKGWVEIGELVHKNFSVIVPVDCGVVSR